jgi:hypothetical protein
VSFFIPKKTSLFIAINLITINYAFSQGAIADVKLEKKLSILNGRAYFSFPTAAINMERPTDLMAAGPNPNEETRIVYNIDKMRLVFFAQELFLDGDKNLFNEVTRDSAYKINFKSKVFTSSDSLYSILSTPLNYDTAQAGIMINSLLVQTSDGTLFRIDAYINNVSYSNKDQFRQLTERVFQTLINGPRKSVRVKRTEKYFVTDSSKTFTFSLPAEYCVTVDRQYDFEVFKFHKYRSFTDSTWADMVIYVGDHPSYLFMNYGLDEHDAKKDSGTFLNGPVQWLLFRDDMRRVYLKEQMIPHSDIEQGTTIHVAMLSNKKETLPELTEIAKAVKLSTK